VRDVIEILCTHIAAAPPTGAHRTHEMLSSLAWHTGALATLLHT